VQEFVFLKIVWDDNARALANINQGNHFVNIIAREVAIIVKRF